MDFLSTQFGKVIGIAASAVIGSIPIALAAANESLVSINWEGLVGLLVQAGALGVVALLLMHVMPAERRAQREMYAEMRQAIKDQAAEHKEAIRAQVENHSAIVSTMLAAFEKHDAAWRDLINKRGICPIEVSGAHLKMSEEKK